MDDKTVHIWQLDLSDAESFASQIAILAPDERTRADRFIFHRDRQRYIAVRAALRQILAHYLNASPAEISFIYGAHGKPSLPNSEIQFNLAHSGDLAVYGLTLRARIGIDVEQIRPLPEMPALIADLFSSAEQAEFARLPADQQIRTFFSGWTRKEAVIKALGVGLNLPLASFDVTLDPDDPNPRISRLPGDWSLYSFVPALNYAAALAVEASDHAIIRCGQWTIR